MPYNTAGEVDSKPEDLGSFCRLRDVRNRAVMLELRKKGGHGLATGYSEIVAAFSFTHVTLNKRQRECIAIRIARSSPPRRQGIT